MNDNWVCIGHSHAGALRGGAATVGIDLDVIDFWGMGDPWVHDDSGIHLRPDLASRVGNARLVLSVIGGEAHAMLGLFDHPKRFDFVLPDAPDLPVDETREIVPAEAVRIKLAQIAGPHLGHLSALLAVASGPVLQIEPPPPMADGAWFIRHAPWSMFPEQTDIIAPKWLRYKMWRLHIEVIRKACATHGIRTVPVPKGATDPDGFMFEHYAQDAIHGNAAYGALVLDTLRQFA